MYKNREGYEQLTRDKGGIDKISSHYITPNMRIGSIS